MKTDIDVIALGGNAILPAEGEGTIEQQREVTRRTMKQICSLIKSGRKIIITHGNGPIVGNIIERGEAVKDHIPPMPIDVCGADSQGGIGYMVQQILGSELRSEGINKEVVSLISQVRVAEDDDAFDKPTKPIGPFYTKEEKEVIEREKDWIMKEDAGGRGFRRVVPSPTPLEIIETPVISKLLSLDVIIIAVGGGGIPVVRRENGFEGVEAVIDKDRAASVLSEDVKADRLIILTNVDYVYVNYGKSNQEALERISLSDLTKLYRNYEFPAGSMGPKVRAAIDFLESGGDEAIISHASHLLEACEGKSGTHIYHD
ncbi:MAG: carbamate kinase [Candidatus Krumholzibacteriota bacterium]|nr:carbamate kinase [Candidatus Krumholzibacteriota bacterium]